MILAIDIGGTYTKYGYVCDDKVLSKGKWKTIFSFNEVYKKIEELIRDDTERLCISSGGFWDEEGNGLGYESIPETAKNNLVKFFKEKYGFPVTIQNDARCALLCEKKYGSLKDCENAVAFVLGSSVGSAVLINGKLYEGAHKKAGMFFKMPESLEPYTYENFANTVAQTAAYKKAFSLESCNMKDIENFAQEGEEAAKNILKNYISAVSKKILYSKLMYDPEKIVIGGGVANSSMIFEGILQEYNNLLCLIDEKNDIPIERTSFGEESNLIGATLEEYLK